MLGANLVVRSAFAGTTAFFASLLLSAQSQPLQRAPATAETRGVPGKLFGIALGSVHTLGNPEANDFGTMPVKKFAGMNSLMGHGVHYYFEPRVEHKFFEYIEKREKPEDKYFETSFRLYLLPLIPSAVGSVEELSQAEATLKWEVALIEWSVKPNTKEEAYFWAVDACKTFQIDISVKPKITDHYKESWYECKFSTAGREFTVSSFYAKSVKLSYTKELHEKKEASIEKILRKLKAANMRPY